MRSRLLVGSLVAGILAHGCGPQSSVERTPAASQGPLSVYDAYAPASPTSDVASVYFTVVNDGSVADTLLGVAIPTGTARLHEVITENDRTHMSPVEALAVPAHGRLALRPGGYHIMLSDMGKTLAPGDTVQVQLHFALEGYLCVPVAVFTYTEVVERLEGTGSQP